MGVHFITGAGSGIGAALAAAFAARGEELWLLARNEERARVLRARFPRCRTPVADLAATGSLGGGLTEQELPARLDSLIHVAGVAESGTVAALGADVWQDTLAVNVAAPAELTRLLLPALRAARGHVVFMNSGAGLHAPPRLSAYAASKFALKALAESLRAEEYGSGIRVTTVYPGETDTPMQVRLHEQFGLPYDPEAHMSPDSVAAAVLTALDLPRDTTMSDLMLRPGR
ncbi:MULTISPECIES: SDR family oxidoreductase [Streptomyces]|uniref:SDR family oxidoreductase n=1 Tax=Streptomyces sp. 900105245 TaxID=3154379 RepID=A0ABV1U9R1_9ACTN|nr:SDR family oxidoreductase [Streptomyces sp. PanSC9]ROP55689.1 short-subunit dehydrogenase [Streptomyces sp. PanSC9]